MPHDYYDDVKKAKISPIWPILDSKFSKYSKEWRIATFDEDYYQGIDLWCGGIGIQVKQRNTYYDYDMCLEHHHEYEDGKIVKGWAHKDCAALYLFYYWHNCFKRKKCTVALMMQMDNLLTAVKQNSDKWGEPVKNNQPTIKDGQSFYTYNHMIPIQTLRKLGVFIGHYDMPIK